MQKFFVFISSIFFISFLLLNLLSISVSADSYWDGLYEAGGKMGYDALNKNLTLPEMVGRIVSLLLISLGVIFLAYMIYGGYTWMIVRSNAQSVEKAKEMIKDAVVGLLIVLAAYAITNLVSYIWMKT